MRSSVCILMGASVCFLSVGCATRSPMTGRDPRPEALALAESGDSEAQCMVGSWYLQDGNYPEAAKWLQKANAHGSLAWLYLNGKGVTKDVKRGIQHLRIAADCPPADGNDGCAEDLAEIYRKGRLAPRNYSEAYHYFGVAVLGWPEESLSCHNAAQNLYRLVERRKAVGRKLTAAERSAQDERLRTWAGELTAVGWRPSLKTAGMVGVQVPQDSEDEPE